MSDWVLRGAGWSALCVAGVYTIGRFAERLEVTMYESILITAVAFLLLSTHKMIFDKE